MDIPVLSVRQPWADAIVDGLKGIENRTWRTKHRGRIWIHAGKLTDPSDEAIRLCGDTGETRKRGFIIGSVDIEEIVRNHESKWAFPDCWHWILTKPKRLEEPIAVKGQTRLFKPQIEIIDR